MAHREGIREFLKNVEVHGLVYDWGAGTKPIKNYLKPNQARFVGIDKLDHVGADLVIDLDNEHVALEPSDFAFCIEVIEHVWNTEKLITSIYDSLKLGGMFYLSQPFFYEVHKEDDRIRYTYHGLRQLLEGVGFTVEDIQPTVGDLDHAEGYVVRARK